MPDEGDDDLIDVQDLKLTADEISAKALALVRSIGLSKTEESGKVVAAKARAYFKRAFALRDPPREYKPPTFPLPSEIRWRSRHEAKSWEQIHEEWIGLRSQIQSLAQVGWSTEQVELLQELTRLECFIEDCWADQSEVIEEIQADRIAAEALRPPF
jgi:hypothetical protein